jgi:hypothetical protein
VVDEHIPQVPPDIPAQAAWQLMRDLGLDCLFLMHAWPGEPRPSAVITRQAIEARLGPHLDATGLPAPAAPAP